MSGAEQTYDRILVHYAEIGTKGGNRASFEARLRRNIAGALTGLRTGRVRRETGRMTVALGRTAQIDAALKRLAEVPGIAWFAPVRTVASDIESITEAALFLAEGHDEGTFRVETRRLYKPFPLDSLAVNRHVGAALAVKSGRRVALAGADKRYGLQIDKDHTYVFWDRREGPGGLPVGTQGELIALLSGGIDSPVAAYRMMLRGCRIHLVHFLNRSIDTNRVRKKILALAERLCDFQGPTDLTIVPFEEIQREIVMVVPARFRMIIYRRMMFRVAEALREESGALGYVTGDSVGQVASQTLENLAAIHDAVTWPIYSPLAGSAKREIVDEAKVIDTFATSILPHEDCCSFLVAKHPETRADVERVRALEVFDPAPLVRSALTGRECHRFDPRARIPDLQGPDTDSD